SVQDVRSAAWYNGTRGIVLAVQRQPGTNTVQVAARVRAAMDRIRSQLPASVQIEVLYDRSLSIEESVNDVKFTLMLTVALVVMVIFLFLRSLSATIIPSLALPMSVVGTFAVMYKLGYSLDNLSLMALTLSVGFVVDDAIVMLENIVRHLEMGKKPFEAALDGAKEIGFTILSMTVSLVAVFIPLLLLGGLIGRLFHEFAVTIGVAILVSGFVSLTLTPMLCARFLKGGHEDIRHNRVLDTFEKWYQATHDAYVRSLGWVMEHRRTALGFTVAIMVGTLLLGKVVKTGFIPNDDIGQLTGTTETAEGTSFAAMRDHQMAAAAIVAEDPNVDGFMSAVGGRGSTNQGRIFMRLKPRHDRSMNSDQIAANLTRKLSVIPGLRVFITSPPAINIGGRQSKSQYQYTLQGGTDLDELYAAAQRLEARLREVPQLKDVTTDLQIRNPQVSVEIDRDRAAQVGISAQQVEQALYNAYGGRQVSTIFTPTNQYWVVLELLPEYQRDLDALRLLSLRAP
ncbi:MAG TPA: efflux RND transporter permease subunit, partial [Gemmatimonadales bacterium]